MNGPAQNLSANVSVSPASLFPRPAHFLTPRRKQRVEGLGMRKQTINCCSVMYWIFTVHVVISKPIPLNLMHRDNYIGFAYYSALFLHTVKLSIHRLTPHHQFYICGFAAILCPPLQDPANGNVDVPSREVGATATYTCNVRYELSGLTTRTCQSDGSWFGIAPTCVPGNPRSSLCFKASYLISSSTQYTVDIVDTFRQLISLKGSK